MNEKERIIAAFTPHIGKTITYTPHKDLPQDQRIYGKFVIKRDTLRLIQHYNLEIMPRTNGSEVWAPIDDIYWGQGYHSVLYGNADGVMFVVENGEREYVTFDA